MSEIGFRLSDPAVGEDSSRPAEQVIDVVFIPEGFDNYTDLPLFYDAVDEIWDAFINTEPFRSRQYPLQRLPCLRPRLSRQLRQEIPRGQFADEEQRALLTGSLAWPEMRKR